MRNKIIHSCIGVLLWNNHFYGICIVGIAMSSGLFLTGHLPSIVFLTMAYIATVAYYTNAYFNESVNEHNQDRANWYQKNYHYLKTRQWLLIAALLMLISKTILDHPQLLKLDYTTIIILTCSFVFSILYNHTNFKKQGMLKSLVIAFVWTILGGYMPVYFNTAIDTGVTQPILTQVLYLVQLFLFIFLLAVLFDIKDMKKDQMSQIQTIPIQIGLMHIQHRLVSPILLLSIVIDLFLAEQFHYNVLAWVIQGIFYFVVYRSAILAIKEEVIAKSILLIDGLMILKAVMSILSWYCIVHA